MRKAKRFCWLPLLLVMALFFWSPSACFAEVVQGQAVIDPSNLSKARTDAMQDAMRTFVEMKVGVHVTSSTETSMGMVVRDEILAKSDGYVLVNKIVKEWQDGPVYCVKVDLTASDQKIKTAIDDVYNRLQALNGQNTSRSSIEIALTGRDASGNLLVTNDNMNYVQQKLANAGFTVTADDEVKAYMDRQTDLNSPAASAEIRRIARNSMEHANALLRGTLVVADSKHVGNYWQATVHASFELVGLESSEVNSFDDYFTAVDTDEKKAFERAREIAVQHAVDELGQKALNTVQNELRGGTHHIKTVVVVNGITDRNGQSQAIRQALAQSNCRIIRSSFTSEGVLKLFIEADGYGTMDELEEAIRSKLPGLQQADTDESAMGSAKIYLKF